MDYDKDYEDILRVVLDNMNKEVFQMNQEVIRELKKQRDREDKIIYLQDYIEKRG